MTVTKAQIIDWLGKSAAVLEENKAYLTELDGPIGDSDHGVNIARGFGAVAENLPDVADQDIGSILKMTAMTLMSKVGGASGMLYGNFFLRAAMGVNGKETLSADDLNKLLEVGVGGIVQRGRAVVGDKTMIDAWTPALAAFQSSLTAGREITAAMRACVDAAEQGMKDTIPLQARKGRASYLGERSIGHQDPGATSTYLILNALLEAIEA